MSVHVAYFSTNSTVVSGGEHRGISIIVPAIAKGSDSV